MVPTEAQAPPFDLSQFFQDPHDWSNAEPVDGEVFIFDGNLSIKPVVSARIGSRNTFGPGLEPIAFSGFLGHKGWDVLTSRLNQFWVVPGAVVGGGINIYLGIDGEPVGIVVGVADGAVAEVAGVGGSFYWK